VTRRGLGVFEGSERIDERYEAIRNVPPVLLGSAGPARLVYLTYVAVLSLILYLDRICISQAAGPISGELGLNKVQLGWKFSAFTLGFVLFEVPSGAWGDRYRACRRRSGP
jgi:MFS family permease